MHANKIPRINIFDLHQNWQEKSTYIMFKPSQKTIIQFKIQNAFERCRFFVSFYLQIKLTLLTEMVKQFKNGGRFPETTPGPGPQPLGVESKSLDRWSRDAHTMNTPLDCGIFSKTRETLSKLPVTVSTPTAVRNFDLSTFRSRNFESPAKAVVFQNDLGRPKTDRSSGIIVVGCDPARVTPPRGLSARAASGATSRWSRRARGTNLNRC